MDPFHKLKKIVQNISEEDQKEKFLAAWIDSWCQSRDPWKTANGWTSGNNDIDNFALKNFNLKLQNMKKQLNGFLSIDRREVDLRLHFKKLTLEDKLLRLIDISKDLFKFTMRDIHYDFHNGNILQHKGELGLGTIKSYIADLDCQKYTQAADVYGFGVVMAEITTVIPPFDGLTIKICCGLRPKCALGTPDFYSRIMNSDPQKWPTAKKAF
ncbi:hypothetical protein C2G38_2189493 [Gigaspora rosea]|uniref:Protein kinase domain-containing protein n=1 Tax=Gigaspora rosea TaxID=44941 RepID=A0A397V3J8_9GLOM|nr:hypothetical protein C2G38_2189493 [Gigaspora rosea]